MKISEIGSIVQHPAVAKEAEFVELLQSKDQDEIIEFVMDERNAEGRRLYMLRHLDELLGDLQDTYDASDLENFVTGGDDFDISPEEADEIARDMRMPPYHVQLVDEGGVDLDDLEQRALYNRCADDEMNALLGCEPDDDMPTGEYEICQRCGGEGCIECEEGLKDITGMHKALNLDDFIGGE